MRPAQGKEVSAPQTSLVSTRRFQSSSRAHVREETGLERGYRELDQRFSDSVGKSDLTEGAPKKREENKRQVDDRVMKHWLEAYADQTYLTSI